MPPPRLLAIYIAPDADAPMREVQSVEAVAGRGLVGDRYYEGTGHWSRPGLSSEVTLVATEDLAATGEVLGRSVDPATTRRNLLTEGLDLTELIGQRFRIGDVHLEGVRPCDPCGYLERENDLRGLREALEGRGGLRARIVTGGRLIPGPVEISSGDSPAPD